MEDRSELTTAGSDRNAIGNGNGSVGVGVGIITTLNVLSRYASMEEVERVMKFALDTSAECCIPFMLMEAHLNLAELSALRGDQFQGE